MFGELTNIPTDTLVGMMFAILKRYHSPTLPID
jgi:hypothetical protein